MWVIILSFVLVLLVYFKTEKCYKYWKDRGVPYVKPFLIFGNLAPNLFRRRALADLFKDMYNLYPNERYVGIFQFLQPILMIRDPDLIKQLTIKDFDAFPDHNMFVTGDADPLFSRNLFSRQSKEGWHDMRTALSPSFTSSKMKTMFVLMQQCSTQFVHHLKNQNGTLTVELKDAFARFTNDVIGTTAFGVTCNSFRDRDNEFYLMGKDATDFVGIQMLKLFGYAVIPSFMKFFSIKLLSKKVTSFFVNLIKETLRIRQEQNVVRPDMVHLLMEAKKNWMKHDDQDGVIDSGFAVAQESDIERTHKVNKIEITDDDIIAQALIFFVAGFDSVSTLMSYTAYELAINPDIQDRLYQEIDGVLKQCNGHVTYEALLGMKYLDAVLSETLRRHAPSQVSDRKSVKPYTIQPELPGEQPVDLPTGSIIFIPIGTIHMDPKHYSNPERFDPERFNDENKHNIKPFTFLPFGVGPRICIGSRFALLESKLIIVELLRCFQFVPVDKTQIPIKLSKSNPLPLPDGGFWVGLTPR